MRTSESKRKDGNDGYRAELLNAIAWATQYPTDMIAKSSKDDDIKNHIDWYVYSSRRTVTYDTKARKFGKYGNLFDKDLAFIAEIERRYRDINETKTGSIYGNQDYMSMEIQGAFVYIYTKQIRNYVDEWVTPFKIPAQNVSNMFGSIYTNDDNSQITALEFQTFTRQKRLSIPEEFKARQFHYKPEELEAYIRQHNLNIKL